MAILDELLVRLGVDMSEAEGEVDRGSRGITGRLDGLAVAGGAAAAGLGAAFVTGLQSAMDISSVTTQLQNQLDLTDQEAARAGSIAGDVFSAGFGESMGEVGEALDSVASSMHEFGSISDAEMAQLTKDALALSKTFQFDVGEAAVGAGNMIKSGLAKDGTEAMDLMAAAAQKMPKAMREELPAVTKEYSEFFAQLGATGPEMMGALAAAAENPLFEIDKLGDAVKEFTLRISDTEAVAKPLQNLGLDVGEIQEIVNKGEGTKAFDQITKALSEVESQTDRTRLAGELMGGAGEDAQASLKAFGEAGGFAGNELKDTAGAAKKLADNMEASPAQQFDSVMRSVTTTLGELLLPALRFVSELFAEHPGVLKVILPIVLALAAALAVAAAAQWAMNSAVLANPYVWIAIAIIALVAVIIANWDKIKEWTIKAWNAVWSFIKNAAGKIWNLFLNWTIIGLVIKHWSTIRSNTVQIWNAVVGWLRGVPGMIFNAFLNFTPIGLMIKHWNTIKRVAIERALALVAWMRGLPGRISRGIGSLRGLLVSAGKDLIRGMIKGVRDMAGSLVSAGKDVVGDAVSGVKGALGISSPSRVFRDIGKDTARGLIDGLRSSRRAVAGAARDMAGTVKDAFTGRGGMEAATDELRRLVESGSFKKQGSLLFEDVAFQGMSKNFEKFHGDIADGFWNAVFEIEKAVKRGKTVFEDFTFQGMSKDVERYGSTIAKLFHNSAVTRGTSTATGAFRARDLFPGLADGGIVTRPTLAMIGEGGEDEAVLPLSHLERMINTVRAPSVNKVQPVTTRVVIDVTGADEDMKRLFARIIRLDGPESLGLAGG